MQGDVAAVGEVIDVMRNGTQELEQEQSPENWATELVSNDRTHSLPGRCSIASHNAPALEDELRELHQFNARVPPHSTLEVLAVAVMCDSDSARDCDKTDDSKQPSSQSDGRAPRLQAAHGLVCRTDAGDGSSNSNSGVALSEGLEEAVVSYHDQLLPRLVVGGLVSRATLRAELVGAKADRVLLSDKLAMVEAQNATLRAQLESSKGGG
jgi:hypothetical protein